jgi:hypothetical protein
MLLMSNNIFNEKFKIFINPAGGADVCVVQPVCKKHENG